MSSNNLTYWNTASLGRTLAICMGIWGGLLGATPPAQGSSIPIPVTALAKVDAVTASGMDVDVGVTTRCSLDVIVRSARCGEVERISVAGDPDSAVSYSLNFPALLQHAFTCGPQFTVELAGLKSFRPTEHFRVEVTCDTHQVCSANIATGVLAEGAIPMSPPLASAWNSLGPHTDLMAALRQTHPELQDDIDTYAFHLADWLKETGQELTGNCLCQWTGVVDQMPMREAMVADPGNPSVSGTASASLAMVPRCVRLGSGEHRVLKDRTGGIYASLPAIESCQVPKGLMAETGWEGQLWAAAGGDWGWDAAAGTRFRVDVDKRPTSILLLSAERPASEALDFAVDILSPAATLSDAVSREVEVFLGSNAWVDRDAGAATLLEARTWGGVTLWGVGLGGGGEGDPTPGEVRTAANDGGELGDTIDDGECIEH